MRGVRRYWREVSAAEVDSHEAIIAYQYVAVLGVPLVRGWFTAESFA